MSVFVSKTEFQKRKLKQYQIAKENDWLFLLILIDTYWAVYGSKIGKIGFRK